MKMVRSDINPPWVRRAVPLPKEVKQRILSYDVPREAWTYLRSRQLHSEYHKRREYYCAETERRGLVYNEVATIHEIRARIASRGYTPVTRKRGDVHTFACIPMFGWHEHLLPDLRELGPVTHFDYTRYGFGVEEFASATSATMERRKEMLKLILPALRDAHARRPVDWIFCYGGGQDTSPSVIRQITRELAIPTADMSLDDKQGWAGPTVGECRAGAIDITREFDLFMTSARVACDWHLVAGGRGVYMPEGFSDTVYHPMKVEHDIPVSFVGAAYGFRLSVVDFLQRHGVDVRTFGFGWPRGGWAEDSVNVFNRSIVNLGMGGIGYSEELTNLKGRDFEVPGTGGGVYLTSFNPDLAQHFEIGREILCYRNRDEMLELIRYYLARPEKAAAIARAARERSLREHRWLHRYETMLRVLGILDDKTAKERD